MRLLDKTRERKSQAICMTLTVYYFFACSHHFQKPGRSRKVRTFLLHDQLDVIDDKGHQECGFTDQAFLLKLLGYSQPAQSVFAIQVKRFKPSSVGISKSLSFAREDMEKYKIQSPTSMTLLQNISSNIASPCVNSNPRCPSKGV